MSALSNMSAHAVLPLGAYHLDDLRKSALQYDQVWLQCDLSACKDKKAILDQLGTGLKLPKHYGKNLDALYDCLTELKPNTDAAKPGFVVVLQDMPESKEFGVDDRDGLLDVFRDAADFFYDAKVAFRVFYSVKH
jgi:RNAse (barnase) inhibitor barstar